MPEASLDALLARARQIEGIVLGCVVDAATGMVLGSVEGEGKLNLSVAAAGAADVANAVSLMSGELAVDGGLEDVIVTLKEHYHLIRHFSPAPRLSFLLLVVLDRAGTNLAMALRQLRDLDVGFDVLPERGPGDV